MKHEVLSSGDGMVKVDHGKCKICDGEMICYNSVTCCQHMWIEKHIDPMDCANVFRSKMEYYKKMVECLENQKDQSEELSKP